MASEDQEASMDDPLLNNLSFSSLLLGMVRPFADASAQQPGKWSTPQGVLFDDYSFFHTPNLAPLTPEKLKSANGECTQGNDLGLEGNTEGFEGLVGEEVVRGNSNAEITDLKENDAVDSSKKVQSKAKKKKHRPKVITESKPRVKKKEVGQSNRKKEPRTKRKAKDEISVVKNDDIKLKRARTPRKRKQPASEPTVKVPETPDKAEAPSTKRSASIMLDFGCESCSYTSDFMTPERGNKFEIVQNGACQRSIASHSSGLIIDNLNSSETPAKGFTELLMDQEHKRVKRSISFSTDEGPASYKECCSGIQSTEENRSNFFANENPAEMSSECQFPCHYVQRTDDTCVSSNVHEHMKEPSTSQFSCYTSKEQSFPPKGSEIDFLVPHSSGMNLDDGGANHCSLLERGNRMQDNSENLNSQALVLYSQNNAIVPVEKVKRRQRARVFLDERTTRVWKLLMDNIKNEGVDGTGKEDTAYWKNERDIFLGRANNFIAKMHLVQGDRRFSCWKGSVVDSVVGVFLTQNVADNLSSSAFMSMAARFPNKMTAVQEIYDACFPDMGGEVQEICDAGFPDMGKELQQTCVDHFLNEGKELQGICDAPFSNEGKGVQEICDETFDIFKHLEAKLFPCNSSYINSQTNSDGPEKGNEAPKSDSGASSHASNEAKEPQRNSNVDESNASLVSSSSFVQEIDANKPQRISNLDVSNGSQVSSAAHFEELDAKEPGMNSNFDVVNGSQVSSTMLVEENDATEPKKKSDFDGSNGSQTSSTMPVEDHGAKQRPRIPNFDGSNGSQTSSTIPAEQHEAKQPRNSNFDGSNDSQVSSTMLVKEHEAKEPQRISIIGGSNGSQVCSTMLAEDDDAKELKRNSNGSQVSSSMLAEEHDTQESQRNLHPDELNSSAAVSSMTPDEDRVIGGSFNESSFSGLSVLMNFLNDDLKISAEGDMIKAHSETTVMWNKAVVAETSENTQNAIDLKNTHSETMVMGHEAVHSMEVVAETVESTQKAIDLEKKIKKINEAKRKAKSRRVGDEIKENFDWNELRKQTIARTGKTNRSEESKDALDWDAVRCADIEDVADTIRERGMNNMLAERIKAFLNKLMTDFGSIDLEWIRDIDPDRAKEYLLTIRGLGLKSVECVRLLTLHQHAFPVDTNVGRIAVRLGWVPLHPLPESLQLHLLELYPILDSIQKYLWPRLCKLDQKTLYELHYQMITFGKVFCTKNKPNCNACPMRAECRHFASAFASARLALPSSSTQQEAAPTAESLSISINKIFSSLHEPIAEPVPKLILRNDLPIVELPPDSPERPNSYEMTDDSDDDDIPAITQNMKDLSQNLQEIMNLQDCEDLSKAIVALTKEAASIPTPKLKNVSRLRTEHLVYELPDFHPLVLQLEAREPDDPSYYLFAIWSPGEAEAALNCCADDIIAFGTLLIPCRTAMRGRFPLNGTYFQVNEVFADHESSQHPIAVSRESLWDLHRRTVYFGTSVSSIFKGLCTEEIQRCFWKGFVCVRGFDRGTRAPRPLMRRLHLAASKVVKEKTTKKSPTSDSS